MVGKTGSCSGGEGLALVGGPCSVKLQSNYPLMDGVVLPPW